MALVLLGRSGCNWRHCSLSPNTCGKWKLATCTANRCSSALRMKSSTSVPLSQWSHHMALLLDKRPTVKVSFRNSCVFVQGPNWLIHVSLLQYLKWPCLHLVRMKTGHYTDCIRSTKGAIQQLNLFTQCPIAHYFLIRDLRRKGRDDK